MSFAIRQLIPSDASAFRDLRLEAVRTHPVAFYGAWEEESQFPLSRFEAWIAKNVYFGGFHGDHLIGSAGLGWQNNPKLRHKCSIFAVYMKEQYRGHGHMRALLSHLLEFAAQRFEIAQLTVSTETPAAFSLYSSLGFTPYGKEEKAMKIGNEYSGEILMSKELQPS